jgi:hypothetical protein
MPTMMRTRPSRPAPAVVALVPTNNMHVDADGRIVNDNAIMQNHVDAQRSDNCPDSIKNVYDGKKKEYELYCEAVYPDNQFKYTVDRDKTYAFLYYQAHRLQKKRGKRKLGVAISAFNHTEYKEAMKKLHTSSVPVEPDPDPTLATEEEETEPLNEKLNLPVGIEQMNHYKSMLKTMWKDQRQQNVNSFGWEQVWCNQHEELYLWVKSRKVSNNFRVLRVNFVKVVLNNF